MRFCTAILLPFFKPIEFLFYLIELVKKWKSGLTVRGGTVGPMPSLGRGSRESARCVEEPERTWRARGPGRGG